jgi:hypothetical protein
MPEKPPGFRVIEGGKKELKQHDKHKAEPTTWDKHIARVRTLCPSLDQYLRQPPADRIERMILLEQIRKELQALPAGDRDSLDAARHRMTEKFGEYPRTHFFSWRDKSDEQIEWEERYELEFANAIGEKMEATEEQEQKLGMLEDHLTNKAEKAYRDEDSGPRSGE